MTVSTSPVGGVAGRSLNAAPIAMFRGLQQLPCAGLARNTSGTCAFAIQQIDGRCAMLGWALVFFVLALASAALGFGGLAGVAASIAQILFVVFLALTVLAFVVRAVQGRSVL